MNVLHVKGSDQDSEAQRVIDQLIAEARTPEDVAYIGELQAELNADRATTLAGELGPLAMRPDGTVDSSSVISAEMRQGDFSHTYGRGGRRA